MPYSKLADLPQALRKNLPRDAQKLYKEAFNNAWQEYGKDTKHQSEDSVEQTSHRVAWAAVKRQYHKDGSHKWKRKEESK